jgi:hypothetical protein
MQLDGIDPPDGLAFIDCVEGIALTWVAFAASQIGVFDNMDKLRFPLLDSARGKHRHDEASYRRMISALVLGIKGLDGVAKKRTARTVAART